MSSVMSVVSIREQRASECTGVLLLGEEAIETSGDATRRSTTRRRRTYPTGP
jgi:hypothetical protein